MKTILNKNADGSFEKKYASEELSTARQFESYEELTLNKAYRKGLAVKNSQGKIGMVISTYWGNIDYTTGLCPVRHKIRLVDGEVTDWNANSCVVLCG